MPKLIVKNVSADESFADMIRINFIHRPGIRAGQICVVECGPNKVRLAARGNSDRSTAIIDLKTRNALGISKFGQPAEISIRQASAWGFVLWALNASEPMPRIAAWLGVLSLALGALGVVLGGLSIYFALLAM